MSIEEALNSEPPSFMGSSLQSDYLTSVSKQQRASPPSLSGGRMQPVLCVTPLYRGVISPQPMSQSFSHALETINEPTWIIINTFEELEATTLYTIEETIGFRPLALGPLINAPSFKLCKGASATSWQSHLDWLQMHPKHSVLYIAFGTVVKMSQVQLEELVLGCIVEQWGIGLVFDASGGTSGLITSTEVEKKVKTLMQSEAGKQMRDKAKNLSASAQRAYKEGGSSRRCLDRLEKEISAAHKEIWQLHIKK
ncbi:hypothetical protein GOP47_0000593 [Adiantum capillus-veneris]|uniref:Uncharacterized protein n=1 Tax=Adiantum capillus-veneris TaxID=13818 RepID=A0A9D4VE63_ADICA|nr:hypothetical protein GOP47_0000593 [Adiantum capillus-veneris]